MEYILHQSGFFFAQDQPYFFIHTVNILIFLQGLYHNIYYMLSRYREPDSPDK